MVNSYSTAIVETKEITSDRYCKLTLKAPAASVKGLPGQFVMLYLPSEYGPMLPRPFSIYATDREKGLISLLFEIRGRGTELVAGFDEGSGIKLLGPLGSCFPEPRPGALLLAGGLGVAPLAFLAKSAKTPVTVLYAVQKADNLAFQPEELTRPGLILHLASEDGSIGYEGTALDLLAMHLEQASALYSCGPRKMLSKAASMAAKAGIECFLSLEERMACGIGACLGCVTETVQGYKRVCSDGPVFAAGEVVFNGKA